MCCLKILAKLLLAFKNLIYKVFYIVTSAIATCTLVTIWLRTMLSVLRKIGYKYYRF